MFLPCLRFVSVTCLLVVFWGQHARGEDALTEAAGTETPEIGVSAAIAEEALVTPAEVKVELAASEPDVVDPVAIRFDEQGRMWVIEMRDYPLPIPGKPPTGRIKVLQDSDHDGIYETATTFAKDLVFPTGLQPWQDGVIVTVAGQILFLADEDGDLKADRTEVWFEGFAQENEQLRANHPVVGPDGLVYVASGLRGGSVVSKNEKWESDAPVDLRGVDFAFDPQGGFFGPVSGNSQYGLTIDDFGVRIGCSNRRPAIQAVLPLDAIRSRSGMAPADALHDAGLSGGDSEVRPIAKAWTTSNLHAGQFSAACGVLRGCGPGMPAEWRDSLFVCEPTSYLVQRQQPVGDRAVLQFERSPGIECLASKNSWFRPVDLAYGPDGCLYVVDMMRAVIEHPQWMPEELKTRADMRWGDTQGRIWRLSAADFDGASAGRLLGNTKDVESLKTGASGRSASADGEAMDAIANLGSNDPWRRELASRKLWEAAASADGDSLEVLISHLNQWMLSEANAPEGLARAIQFMDRQGKFTADLQQRFLKHDDPRIRALVVRLLESKQALPEEMAMALASDASPLVRYQIAIALTNHQPMAPAQIAAFSAIAAEDAGDVWFDKLCFALPAESAAKVLENLLANSGVDLPLSFWQGLAKPAGKADPKSLVSLLEIDDSSAPKGLAVFAGLALPANWNADSADAKKKIEGIQQLAEGLALDAEADAAVRELGITILGRAADKTVKLRPLLDESTPPALRALALGHLMRNDQAWTLEWLGENFTSLVPVVRSAGIQGLMRSSAGIQWLLDRVEEGEIRGSLIGISNIQRLQASKDKAISKRAKELFAASNANRTQTIKEYAASLIGDGHALNGRKLFVQHCANCHKIDDIGIDVGPDISDSRTKTAPYLLTAVLDPNAAIDAAYSRYTLLTVDGTVHDGLLLSDTGEAVILQIPGGERVEVARDEIESMTTSGVSLMPEGFEQLVNVDQMRDLISFLKNWRYLDGAIPISDRR